MKCPVFQGVVGLPARPLAASSLLFHNARSIHFLLG